ncbi:MAG: aquaporin [Bacteroidota bacterium]
MGTCIFVFIGAGAIITNQFSIGAVGLVGIALAHGLILSIMISAFGGISGGHFNPPVTFGVMIAGRISIPLGLQYVGAQLIGGVLAGLLLHAVFPAELCATVHFGTPGCRPSLSRNSRAYGSDTYLRTCYCSFWDSNRSTRAKNWWLWHWANRHG